MAERVTQAYLEYDAAGVAGRLYRDELRVSRQPTPKGRLYRVELRVSRPNTMVVPYISSTVVLYAPTVVSLASVVRRFYWTF